MAEEKANELQQELSQDVNDTSDELKEEDLDDVAGGATSGIQALIAVTELKVAAANANTPVTKLSGALVVEQPANPKLRPPS